VVIANDQKSELILRHVALIRLPANIKRSKVLPPPDIDGESQEFKDLMIRNQKIDIENSLAVKNSLRKVKNPSLEEVNSKAAWWATWLEENKERFIYIDGGQKIYDFFFDTRFSYYFSNLLHGDLGETRRKTRVIDEITERLPVTMTLNAISLIIVYLTALPIGILAAVRRAGLFDISSSVIVFLFYSLPSFYVGLILLSMTYEGTPDWLTFMPRGQWEGVDYEGLTTWGRFCDRAYHSVLPLFCMVYGSLAFMSRFARSSLLDIIESDYIRTARAKGLSEWVVVMKHALRNGALPVLTLLGSLLPALFGGSVIIEVIFQLRGINLLFF